MHVKPSDTLAQLHFNSEMETDSYVGSDTNTNKEHEVRYYEIVGFYKVIVKLLQNIHFQLKVINFVLGCIPIFDIKYL